MSSKLPPGKQGPPLPSLQVSPAHCPDACHLSLRCIRMLTALSSIQRVLMKGVVTSVDMASRV